MVNIHQLKDGNVPELERVRPKLGGTVNHKIKMNNTRKRRGMDENMANTCD